MPQGLDQAITMRATRLAAAAACLLVLASPARAAGRRVAVLPFDGPYGDRLQGIARASLPADCELVPPGEVVRALRRATVTGPGDAAALAQRLDATLVLEGKVQRSARWKLKLDLRAGSDGKLVGIFTRSGKKLGELTDYTRRDAPRWMRTAIRRHFSPAASRTPVAAAEPDGEVAARGGEPEGELASAPSAASPEPSPEPLWEVSLGPRILSRSFTYTDNVSGLPGHTMSASPALQLEGELYPLVGQESWVRGLGVAGHFETTLGARTAAIDGSSLATSDLTYRAGLRYRYTRGNYQVLGGLDYASHRFQMSASPAGLISPDVVYSMLRPSVTGRIYAGGGVSLALTAAYLHILGVGVMDRTDRFPRMTAVGAEAGAAVGYAFDADWEVRLQADLRHYAHAMHVRSGDPLIVGGALDEHFGAALLLSYRWN
jgi:hypothetical protein